MQCKQEQQLVQEAMEQSEHILFNLNTGLLRITTPKKRSIKSNPDSMKEILNTPCRWNGGQQETAHLQAFNWVASRCRRTGITKDFGDGANPHIEACRKPKDAEQNCRKEEIREGAYVSNIKEEETKLLGQENRSDLAEACNRVLSGAKIQVLQPSIPPAVSNTQEAFSNLVLQLPYYQIQKVICFGCVTKLAGANPHLRDKFRVQLLITLGAVTSNQDAQSGLTDFAETSLSFGTNRMNA